MTDTSRPTSFPGKSWLLALLFWAFPAAAAEPLLSLQFDALEHDALQLEQVDIRLEQPAAGQYTVNISAAELRLPDGQSIRQIKLHCKARLTLARLKCYQGRLAAEHATLGRLSGDLSFTYHFSHGLEQARLAGISLADSRFDFALDGPEPDWRININVSKTDLGTLQQLFQLADIDLQAADVKGRVSGNFIARGWPLTAVKADLQFSELNYNGDSVAQDVGGTVQFSAKREDDSWQNELMLSLKTGELYLVAPLESYQTQPGFYLAIPDRPVVLDTVFAYHLSDQIVTIQDLHYHHSGAVTLNLAGRIQVMPELKILAMAMNMPLTDLAKVYPVYLQPWLIDSAYNDLELAGDAALEVGIRDQKINALGVRLDDVDIRDPQKRFSVDDLETDIQMTNERQHVSTVSWSAIDIYRLNFGAGAIELASNDLNIEVTQWQDVALLDGTLKIDELDLRHVGTDDFRMRMAGSLQSVSLPTLTAALDWPTLSGTLTGEFSGLTYNHGNIRMDGELLVRLFDGRVTISDLGVRDLFGSLPVLTADIGVRDIDLERLTDTFAFGKITGRISGQIDGLKLENWQPVAFDARLSTLDDGNTRHRISQQALNNLSQIGGGLTGALSRGLLRYFDEYSYGELGLSCRLANGFCELGGVREYEGGHYLLTRGGLLPPWVEVKLNGSIIAWDALLQGFEQIAEGEVKIN